MLTRYASLYNGTLLFLDLGVIGPTRYSVVNMARSDEAEWWFNAVYAAVQEIPHGKVTSYGG